MVRLMKPLTISDQENMIMALQDEIRRNDASRYDHRLHGVLLVAQGMTCPRVAQLLGDSHHSVVNWVRRFETEGLAGLAEGQRPGRPSRLNNQQMAKVEAALRNSPERYGLATHPSLRLSFGCRGVRSASLTHCFRANLLTIGRIRRAI